MGTATTLEAIQSLLHSHQLQTCTGGTLNIKESDKKATLRSVQIDGIGARAFSIAFDQCKFPGAVLFAPHDSLHRACDSIAFCEFEGAPYILCIELKSSAPMRRDVAQQLRSAQCFLAYLNALLVNYCQCGPIDGWPRRYFVFHDQGATPLTQRTSRAGHNNTSPETALFIPIQTGAKKYLRQLLDKPL